MMRRYCQSGMHYTMYMDDKERRLYLRNGLKKSNRITPIAGCYYRGSIYATGYVMRHNFLLDSSSFKFVAEWVRALDEEVDGMLNCDMANNRYLSDAFRFTVKSMPEILEYEDEF